MNSLSWGVFGKAGALLRGAFSEDFKYMQQSRPLTMCYPDTGLPPGPQDKA